MPSWNFSPERSLKVQVRPSLDVSSLSTICRCGCSFSSNPYSVSHTSTAALRTTYCVPQMGSKFARLACGTKRRVFAAPCAIAGANTPPVVMSAPAPAVVFKNVLRSITLSPCSVQAAQDRASLPLLLAACIPPAANARGPWTLNLTCQVAGLSSKGYAMAVSEFSGEAADCRLGAAARLAILPDFPVRPAPLGCGQ